MDPLLLTILVVVLLVGVPFVLSSRQLAIGERKRAALAQANRARAQLESAWQTAREHRAASNKLPSKGEPTTRE